MKKKTLVLIIIGVFVLAGIGAAISFATRKGAEKIAENIVNKATNGQVDIDYNSNSVVMNTNGGSLKTGDNVKLPDDFPKDVYVIDGNIKAAITSAENDGHHLSIETTTSPAEAYAKYEEMIKADGWTATTTGTYSGVYTAMATKDDRYLTVSISDSDGKTMVVLTVYRQANTNTTPSAE